MRLINTCSNGNFLVTTVGISGAMSMVKVSGGARESIISPSKSLTDTNDFGVSTRLTPKYWRIFGESLFKIFYPFGKVGDRAPS